MAAYRTAGKPSQKSFGRRGVELGQRRTLAAELLEQHVRVAHRTESCPHAARLLPDPADPAPVEDRPERSQVGSQPPGRYPRLVDVLAVSAEADARILFNNGGHPGSEHPEAET